MSTQLLSADSQKNLPQIEEKLYSVKEMAEYCNVSERTIKNIIVMNSISYRKTEGQSHKKMYSESHFIFIRSILAKNQLNQGRNSNTGKAAVQEVIANTMSEYKIPKTFAEALRLAADQQEQIELLQNKNNNLQIELDQSKEYITIKRMEKLNPGCSFNWRLLKSVSQRIGIQTKDVFDANYGTVKAYHVSVWESVYFDSINYPDELVNNSKILLETAERIIEKKYTFKQVASLAGEPLQVISNFSYNKGWVVGDDDTSPAAIIEGYMTEDGYFTEKGKKYIVEVFHNIHEIERMSKKTPYGKAE